VVTIAGASLQCLPPVQVPGDGAALTAMAYHYGRYGQQLTEVSKDVQRRTIGPVGHRPLSIVRTNSPAMRPKIKDPYTIYSGTVCMPYTLGAWAGQALILGRVVTRGDPTSLTG